MSLGAEEHDLPENATDDVTRLNLSVEISSIGPCRKHVSVTVPQADIEELRNASLEEFSEQAAVPGFRAGRVPRTLLLKRFRTELADQVKQKVLLQSLEQMSEENEIDPITQPDIDVDSLVIPDEGDFSYEFDVEVRPEFDVPDYKGFTIDRPSGDVTDEEFEAYKEEFLDSFATSEAVDRPAGEDDSVVCDLVFRHNGEEIRKAEIVNIRLRPTLRFQDATLEGLDKLLNGVAKGEARSADVTISLQSSVVEMRGETVSVEFRVQGVRENRLPELNREFLDSLDCESPEDLDTKIRDALKRQVEYRQRQVAREQVLEKITESADWDLPESIVRQQTENALRREILEMAQAGFTREQVAARENEIRENAVETTRQALKEHFVLDRIATKEEIECEPGDVASELALMSFQRGEPVRRLRARMVKNGMMENLEAQLRERKAVDFILSHASFKDVPRTPMAENSTTSLSLAICGNMQSSLIDDDAE
ncbi:MAG: trigger factor [Planctomycetaceae bacterium]